MSDCPVYVSLTSIAARIENTEPVIRSILNQDARIDKVILSISADPFMLDDGVSREKLPSAVLEWAEAGIVDIIETENTGPYRKLLPSLRKYGDKDAIFITADDDISYPQGWAKTLVRAVEDHGCVAAFRARIIRMEPGGFAAYGKWTTILDDGEIGPRHDIMPTGRDGVAYHSRFFPDLDMLDELSKLAPVQDDLAWKMACLVSAVPAVRADRGRTSFPKGEYFPNVNRRGEEVALFKTNVKGKNDVALSNLYGWLLAHHPEALTHLRPNESIDR